MTDREAIEKQGARAEAGVVNCVDTINGLPVDRGRAWTRGQQVCVVRVEAIEVLSLCGQQMNCVQGPKEYGSIQPREQGTHLLEKRGCRPDQRPKSPRQVMLELALQRLEHGGVDRA